MNTLVIADTHLPFEHKHYLDFCKDIEKRVKCKRVVHIGDLCDSHAISFHEHNPDGWSPAHEMEEADKHLKKWFKAFPNVFLCRGNHCDLPDRKRRFVGLPKRCFQEYRKIWDLPKGWVDGFKWIFDDVCYEHGTGYAGKYGHIQAAYDNRMSTVIGHAHSVAGVEWSANERDIIFGMNVGCGIDRKAYTFAYGKDFRRKPILAAGVVTDNGRFCQVMPMSL